MLACYIKIFTIVFYMCGVQYMFSLIPKVDCFTSFFGGV